MSSFGALSSLQYVTGDSLLHRLDPRSKYAFAISYSITVALTHSLATSLVSAVLAILAVLLSRLHPLLVWRRIQGIVVFLVIISCFQISINGIETAVFTTLKVLSLFLVITLMFSTTPPEKQTEALRQGLATLHRFGIHTETFVFMFTVAVIYTPLLLEDIMRMIQAQRVRGLHGGRWNLAGRIKDMYLLLTPLLLSMFRRAERLSEAMESRCYHQGSVRTGYYKMELSKHGIIVLILAILLPLFLLYFI